MLELFGLPTDSAVDAAAAAVAAAGSCLLAVP